MKPSLKNGSNDRGDKEIKFPARTIQNAEYRKDWKKVASTHFTGGGDLFCEKYYTLSNFHMDVLKCKPKGL